MALFHLHVTQVKRSAGQSVVTSAAYRAGGRNCIANTMARSATTTTRAAWSAQRHSPAAPGPQPVPRPRHPSGTPWRRPSAARKPSLHIALTLPCRTSFHWRKNIALAKAILFQQLVGRGMIADFAIHQPDKEDGGIPNLHFHVLCPIRPIEPDGKWGVQAAPPLPSGRGREPHYGRGRQAPSFDAVPTTDWGSPETLEHWREAWAAMVNAKFEGKGLTCRIDHRSCERQGL